MYVLSEELTGIIQEQWNNAYHGFPQSLQEKCAEALDAWNKKQPCSEYISWYLANLCQNANFLELVVWLNHHIILHFGKGFLLFPTEKSNKPSVDDARIHIFSTEKRMPNQFLQAKAASPQFLRETHLEIWETKIIPFLEKFLFFETLDHNSPAFNYFTHFQEALEAHAKNVLEVEKAALIWHIQFHSLQNIQHLGLHKNEEILSGIVKRIRKFQPVLNSLFFPIHHLSYLLAGEENSLQQSKDELLEELANIKKENNVTSAFYETTIRDLPIDMQALYKQLCL